ncbi:MAG: acyltransferase family protein [candidate division WOR-3 bacterium]
MNRRENFIDIAKSIGIFLVVLGHTEIDQNLKTFIYSFHMPLFFIISGFLLKIESNFKEFFLKRFKRLILPYFIFSFLTYLFWIFVTGRHGIGLVSEIGYLKPVIGTLIGLSHNDYLVHNISLWFLYVLFLTELIYFYISRIKNQVLLFIVPIILSFIGYVVTNKLHLRLIYGFEKVLIAQVFYFSGFIIKKNNLQVNIKKLSIYKILYLCLIFFVLNQYFTKINGFVDLVGNLFGKNFIIYYLNGFSGSFMVIFLSLMVEKLNSGRKVFELVSKSTLYILGFHEQVLTLIFGIILILFKKEPEVYKSILVLNIIFSLLICIGIEIIYILILNLKDKFKKTIKI